MNRPPGASAERCRHFTGIQHETCAAGVNYRELAGKPEFGMARRLPCIESTSSLRGPEDQIVACDKREESTPEEIAEHEGWMKKRIAMLAKVQAAIKPWRDRHQNESFAEVVKCPICGGRLHLTIAASNGHVHGSCETDDCVRWME